MEDEEQEGRQQCVSDPAGLEVSGRVAPRIVHLPVLHHLLEPQPEGEVAEVPHPPSPPDSSSLGIVPTLQTITEARSTGHDVLEGSADLHNLGVRDNRHPGGGSQEEESKQRL